VQSYFYEGKRFEIQKISGNQDNLLNFISALIKGYGNVGIDKLMVSRLSPSQTDNSRLMVILDLDIYLD
jgi:hypothetical protein